MGPSVRNLVLKIGLRGDIYINGKPATGEQMAEAVTSLNAAGGIVTYYRESPEAKASAESLEAFKQLVALRPKILLGNKARSEWGKLEWFELEEAPHLWRIFLARGQPYLVSLPVPPGQKPEVFIGGGPLPPASEDAWFDRLDFIIRSDRVLETPLHHPELAFAESGQTDSSLHIRISYGANRRWASCYGVSEIPSHLASFQTDIVRVARRMVPGGPG
jgi:hypothetical protein